MDLSLDIAVLVGEMEDMPCESAGHVIESQAHDEGPATHYARAHCPACGNTAVKAYCLTFVAVISMNPLLECPVCGCAGRAIDMVTILGPVKS